MIDENQNQVKLDQKLIKMGASWIWFWLKWLLAGADFDQMKVQQGVKYTNNEKWTWTLRRRTLIDDHSTPEYISTEDTIIGINNMNDWLEIDVLGIVSHMQATSPQVDHNNISNIRPNSGDNIILCGSI